MSLGSCFFNSFQSAIHRPILETLFLKSMSRVSIKDGLRQRELKYMEPKLKAEIRRLIKDFQYSFLKTVVGSKRITKI